MPYRVSCTEKCVGRMTSPDSPSCTGGGIGMDITGHGLELNPDSADRVVRELTLEKRVVSVKSVTASAADGEAKSLAAMEKKKTKLEYTTTLNDRYHNSAVSLAFVLDTAVFVEWSNDLDDTRALALHEFLQLVYWATPQSWSVRTGMVEQILQQLGATLTTGGASLAVIDCSESSTNDNHGREFVG